VLKLTELDHLPVGLLELPASALYQQLDGPTLIHLEGRNKRPLLVSVLQHGNEVTGWESVRRLLKSHYQHDELPRSLLLLIGNVQAAKHRNNLITIVAGRVANLWTMSTSDCSVISMNASSSYDRLPASIFTTTRV